MNNNKTAIVAEKVKAFAIAFIGAGIFSQGTFYFKAQSNYNIPRILYPVYQFLGNKGLAAGMLILGLLLLLYGFAQWKKVSTKAIIFWLWSVAAIVLVYCLLFFTGNKQMSTEERANKTAAQNEKMIDDMRNMEQPDFGIPEIDQHFINFETLLMQYQRAFANKDKETIKVKEDEFMTWNEQSAVLIQKLPSPQEKQKMALYLGKLAMRWQEVK